MTDRSVPPEAAGLYREAPESFIAARDALAERLRADDRDDDAAAVKALRKPTVVAWALNQLADRDPDGMRALLDAGGEVRAAQQAALSSKRGAADSLRDATTARRAAVARLAAEATKALEDDGRASGAHADAVVQALEAASIDADAADALSSGTMERPPAASAGFGGVFGLTALEGGGEGSSSEPTGSRAAPRKGRGGRAQDGEAELRAEVARLRRDRDGAVRRATKARDTADGFARELEGMRRRLEVVEAKHAEAEGKASEGELEAKRAERALAKATERLERGVGSID